jgi:hypothetical protein
MYNFTYLDENHKNYLKDKLNFYDIEHSNLTHINVVNEASTLIIKTNFNLDKSITNGTLPIDLNVIQVLKAKPFINVVFFNETEPDNYDVIKYIRPILSDLGLEENRFTIINNNEVLTKFKGDGNINVYVNHPHIFAGAKEMIKVNYEYKQEKKYLFMSYNRNLKAHRFFFLCLLKKHKLLDSIDWSWLRGDEMNKFVEIPDWFYQQIMGREQFHQLSNEIYSLIKEGRRVSEYEYDIISHIKTDEFDYPNHYKLNPYENSYIHIVNESYYEDKEAILLSEKSIIPLYFSQLPIYLASYNHLKYFREKYDFDLFDDLINHDYDNEPDNYLRMQKLLFEIKRLNDNKEYVIEYCKQNQHRFTQNKQRVIEIVKTFKDSINLKNIFYV